jgi:hypothetical protein
MNKFLLLLLLAASLTFADCVGYNDTFKIRSMDAKMRPVPGAAVTVTFDRGATGGEQYFTTPVKYTDGNGLLDMAIYNQGTNSRPIDCNIVINAALNGVEETVTVEANVHSDFVDVQFADIYPVKFYVRDQTGSPIQGASVNFLNMTNKTDQYGLITSYLPAGNHSYFANYLDASEAGDIEVVDDTEFVVKFTYYKVTVDITDDFGSPLPASLTIFNSTFQMDQGGHFTSDKTFGTAVPYSVDYKGIVTEGTISPASKPDVQIVYDIHSPIISEIKADALDSRPRITMNITDPGKFPSGIDFSSIKVLYRLEPADETTPWDKAAVFTTGRSQVTAEFPEQPADRIVRFKMNVQDKTGNKAEVEGKFTTFAAQVTQNNTENQTGTQENPPQGQGLPLLYIVVGVIVAVLAVYFVIRMKSKATGGS